ncbi:hypothetical protein [Pseudomonas sp. A-RE-19]|uniref:hypothetical protein n=1 Tax=Pseudomonas sp. A-RE-19 TaxID=2832401 RepID=UPI001CBB1A3E|nr:hypothetical protein [Pseudomonas sp. A-RE-19]
MNKLPAFRIVDALSSYPSEGIPFYPQKNLLPDLATQCDLRLQIDQPWAESAVHGRIDTVLLSLTTPDGTRKRVKTVKLAGPITFPLILTLGKQHLVEGESIIEFKVRRHDGVTFTSEPATFTIDKRIPLNGATPLKPVIDDELTYEDGVTPEYLKHHCDMVKVTIEPYSDQAAGDTITVHCGGVDAPPVAVGVVRSSDAATVVAIPGYVFTTIDDGTHLMYHRIGSRAGIQTVNSKGTIIRIDLIANDSQKKPIPRSA